MTRAIKKTPGARGPDRIVVTRGEYQALAYYRRTLKDIVSATLADGDRLRDIAKQALRKGKLKETPR